MNNEKLEKLQMLAKIDYRSRLTLNAVKVLDAKTVASTTSNAILKKTATLKVPVVS